MTGRAVVVYDLADARAALAAAENLGKPVTLLSPEGAAASHGALWFRALVDQAQAEHPAVTVSAILDCADAAGHASAALRLGFTQLRFEARGRAGKALCAIAEMQGAAILRNRPPALDLATKSDRAAACLDWLAEG